MTHDVLMPKTNLQSLNVLSHFFKLSLGGWGNTSVSIDRVLSSLYISSPVCYADIGFVLFTPGSNGSGGAPRDWGPSS